MKTAEEIAKEEQERLQELEEARLKRMRGEDADLRAVDEEDDDDSRAKKSKSRLEVIVFLIRW